MTTAAPTAPRNRTRTRTPARVLTHGIVGPRDTRFDGGFVEHIEGAPDDVDLNPHVPLNHIDTIVQRYTGRAIPLEEAFPEPPPPVTDHPVLERAVRAAAGRFVIAPREPARMNTNARTDEAYRREYQFKALHRMLMRKATTMQMAEHLGLTVGEVMKLREDLFRRLRHEGGSIDMLVHSGMTIGFYDEVRATALRNADLQTTSHMEKTRYLTIALGAENSKHRFLQVAGFYENAKLSPLETNTETDSGISVIQGALRALFDPDASEDEMDGIIDRRTGYGADDSDDLIRVL